MAKQTFTTGSVLTAAQMNSLQANDYNWTVSQKTASYVLVAGDAGTRIEMNAAGTTTITVNSGLFAAGDSVILQNIGAGVCTVTAGTATVNKATNASLALSQYQGGTLYFVSASNAIFFPFDVGSAASGGMTLLGTITFASAAASFTSINQSYKDLYLVFEGVTVYSGGSSDRGFVRLNGDTGSNYNWGHLTQTGQSSTNADSRFDGGYMIGDSGAANVGTSTFRIRNYANTARYKGVDYNGWCYQGTSRVFRIGTGNYMSNSAITSIEFSSANGGGSFNPSAGTVLLYGVS